MKITLLYLFLFLGIWSCADSPQEGFPLVPDLGGPSPLEKQLLRAITDTTGLTLSLKGKYMGEHSLFVIGTKNKKLWCGFFELLGDSIKEKDIWIGQENFTDTMKIIEEYGKKDTLFLNLGYNINRPECDCYYFSKDTFAVNLKSYPTIFICKEKNYSTDLRISQKWTNGYYFTYSIKDDSHLNPYISDCKGNKIYQVKKPLLGNIIPVFLSYYLQEIESDTNSYFYSYRDARTRKEIWSKSLNNIGTIQNGHYPKINREYIINDQEIILTFNMVNYDGSTTVKKVKVNLETGAIL